MIDNKITHLHRSIVVKGLIILVFCLTVLFLLYPTDVHATDSDNEDKIKVGFFEYAGFNEVDENGNFTGYGYEYLMELSKYNDWKYEFVTIDDKGNPLTYDMAMDMLKKGDLDIVGSVRKNPDREKIYYFPTYKVGRNKGILSVRSDDSRYSIGDKSQYKGMCIGLLAGSSRNEEIKNYMRDRVISCTYKEYSTLDELEKAFKEDKEVDGVYSSANKIVLTDEKKQYIEDNPVVRVGIDPNFMPLEYYDDKEEEYLGGISDVMKKISEDTGLEFQYVIDDNYGDALRGVDKGEVDIIAAFANDYSWAEEKKVKLTDSYLDISMSAVVKGNTSEENAGKIAIVKDYYIGRMVEKEFPDKIFVEYSTMQECIDSVRRGDTDITFMPTFCANSLISGARNINLKTFSMPNLNYSMAIGVSENEDAMLYNIINKAVYSIPSDEIDSYMMNNSLSYEMDKTLLDVVLDNYLMIIFILILFIITFGIIFYLRSKYRIQKEQIAELEKEVLYQSVQITIDNSFEYVISMDMNKQTYNFFKMPDDFIYNRNGLIEEWIGRLREHEQSDELWEGGVHFADYLANEDMLHKDIEKWGKIEIQEQYKLYEEKDYRWYEVIIVPLYDKEKHPNAYTVLVRDIQNLKQSEQDLKKALKEAEQAAQAKQDFLSNMSHEMRTPLNGIKGMLDILKEEPGMEHNGYLDKANTSVIHLTGLINDILDMSKIESGRIELKREFLLGREIKKNLMAVVAPIAEKKHIELIPSIGRAPYEGMWCDINRTKQILINILSNAVKYTEPGGHIWLSNNFEIIEGKTMKVTYTIKDDGIGMSKEFLEHIYEPFEQMDKSYNRNGTGLGLAITKRLIDSMGGNIYIDSELGVGTTVAVQFIVEGDNISDTDTHETAVSIDIDRIKTATKGKRVLIAEDNDINMEIAVVRLEALGFSVDKASNGKEAVDKVINNPEGYYTAIFMDIMMPFMDGLEASKTIRKFEKDMYRDKKVVLVAMTANAFAEDVTKSLESGMNYHLSKPFEKQQMIDIVWNIVRDK